MSQRHLAIREKIRQKYDDWSKFVLPLGRISELRDRFYKTPFRLKTVSDKFTLLNFGYISTPPLKIKN
jgi:hypothetical protein